MTRPALLILAAVVLLAGGCKSNPVDDSNREAAAIHANTKAITADADGVDDDADAIRGALGLTPAGFTPALTTVITLPPDVRKVIADHLASLHAHAGSIRTQAAAVDKHADKQAAITDKAVKDKNSGLQKKIDRMWIIGAIAIFVGAIWWMEKGRYAAYLIAAGGSLIGVAIALGWAIDHQGLLFSIFAGIVALVVAVEWIKHPNDGWGHWLWSSLGKSKSPLTPMEKAP